MFILFSPGYVRLILLFASWIFFTNPVLFLAFYSASVILDGNVNVLIVISNNNDYKAINYFLDIDLPWDHRV